MKSILTCRRRWETSPKMGTCSSRFFPDQSRFSLRTFPSTPDIPPNSTFSEFQYELWSEAYPFACPGDVNKDGRRNVSDMVTLVDQLTGKLELLGVQLAAAGRQSGRARGCARPGSVAAPHQRRSSSAGVFRGRIDRTSHLARALADCRRRRCYRIISRVSISEVSVQSINVEVPNL